MILLDTGMRKMPDKCSECNFFRAESQMYCTAVVGYTIVNAPYKRRPVWCPLHEVTDSDTISRQKVISTINVMRTRCDTDDIDDYHDLLLEAIEVLPPSTTVDQDTISRQAAYDTLTEYYHHKTDMQHNALAEALSRVPSIPDRLIRCKDCNWFRDIGCAIRIVDESDKPSENDFCSFAEKKTDSDIIIEKKEQRVCCEYCHEDSDGRKKPLEKNAHAFIRFGMDGWELSLKGGGWHGGCKIKFCPMCGRKL